MVSIKQGLQTRCETLTRYILTTFLKTANTFKVGKIWNSVTAKVHFILLKT